MLQLTAPTAIRLGPAALWAGPALCHAAACGCGLRQAECPAPVPVPEPEPEPEPVPEPEPEGCQRPSAAPASQASLPETQTLFQTRRTNQYTEFVIFFYTKKPLTDREGTAVPAALPVPQTCFPTNNCRRDKCPK